MHNDESPRSFAIIRKWLATCLTDHTKPRINKFGQIVANTICSIPSATKSRLPTRVLDVGSCELDSVKLVITQNELGDYFALSYCWGRISDTTWQTTRSTLHDHILGIQLSALPKTIQDAIKITREFNVQYLWIDSLCILQDDKDDWQREAARMCDVYENSQLTIAAAGASDSTQGCFVSQRREQRPITVRTNPSEDDERSQQPNCQINFASELLKRAGPSDGPLAKRAWVTQEWYLSKRILFCTIGGYSWKCKTLASTERRWGGSDTGPGRNQTWDLVVADYTSRQLTYETDRLIALQGMAVAFGRDRKDRYYFGVWTSDLPELLLWTTKSVDLNNKRLVDIPTWSWASLSGGKTFWHDFRSIGTIGWKRDTIVEQDDFKIYQDGKLHLQAKVRSAQISAFALSAVSPPPGILPGCPENKLWSARQGQQLVYLCESHDAGDVAIGLAALDDTEVDEGHCCVTFLPLMHAPRNHHSSDALWFKPEVEAANTQRPMVCKLDLNNHNYSEPSYPMSQNIWWHKHVSLNTVYLA